MRELDNTKKELGDSLNRIEDLTEYNRNDIIGEVDESIEKVTQFLSDSEVTKCSQIENLSYIYNLVINTEENKIKTEVVSDKIVYDDKAIMTNLKLPQGIIYNDYNISI